MVINGLAQPMPDPLNPKLHPKVDPKLDPNLDLSDSNPKSVLELSVESAKVPGGANDAPSEFRDSPIWAALVSEPLTGVCIATLEGRVHWMNEQSAKIWHGEFAKAAEYNGRTLAELFPPEVVGEYMKLMQRVSTSRKPILVRRIWRGWQTLSWIHLIPGEAPESGAASTAAIPPRMLIISRRVAGEALADETLGSSVEIVESDFSDLGPLDALSDRELEVLALLGQGLSVKEIAAILFRSAKTVENHRQSIGRKLSLDDRVKLSEIARRAGLTVRDADRARS
jgi:DNA-binding CsgD family transcriptional regulator